MIRRLLHGMPTRPAFALAILVMVIAIAGYYYSRYRDCSYHADLRSRLYSALRLKVSGTIKLADVVPFEWMRLTILTGYRPPGKLPECPFGWDWSRQQRRALSERTALNMLVFSRKGDYLDYIDFRRDQVDFQGTLESYTPLTAVFSVNAQQADSAGVVLKPMH